MAALPIDLTAQSPAALGAVFAAAGAVVWLAGARLASLVDHFAERTGIGKAFAGLLLLGGITSLPEAATVVTATATGNPSLAINNLLGSASINVLLLAVGDVVFGRDALTAMSAKPVTLMQGVLGMILLAGVALAVTGGDVLIPHLGVGVGTAVLAVAGFQALRVSARFERERVWEAVSRPDDDRGEPNSPSRSTPLLVALIAAAGAAILAAGTVLSLTGDALAQATGLGDSLTGFVLVGFATSLPELSSVVAALRLKRYELAIGDIFGTNLFNIQLILLADLIHQDGAILHQAGAFEVAASSLACILTGIFVVGLIERRDRTIGRIGHDSALALATFSVGLFALWRLA